MKMRIIFLAKALKKICNCKIDLSIHFFKKIKESVLKKKYRLKILLQQINRHSNFSRYRVEEIDIKNNVVLLYCHFTRGVLSITIMEVILNQEIIRNLPTNQAGALGYFYGKFFAQANKNTTDILALKKDRCFSLISSNSQFKINSLDREGLITFFDVSTNQIFKKYPLEIYKTEKLISNFDAIQACYIGILAGISVTKQPRNSFKKPILTIVK